MNYFSHTDQFHPMTQPTEEFMDGNTCHRENYHIPFKGKMHHKYNMGLKFSTYIPVQANMFYFLIYETYHNIFRP